MATKNQHTTPGIGDLARQERLSQRFPAPTETSRSVLPAEWHSQSGVQLTWPHAATDWQPILPQVSALYLRMTLEIASRELLLIVTPEADALQHFLTRNLPAGVLPNVHIVEVPTNDTWARDHGFITLLGDQGPRLLDFCFNGWGMKFPANLDNLINSRIAASDALHGQYVSHLDFVLEGGAIESDGCGTLLTTSSCLLAPNRNAGLDRSAIEAQLISRLHVQRVLWLDHGHLAGDDTDGHIDTLARFCPSDTIAYVHTDDAADEHHTDLQAMEEQLATFRTPEGKPYRLVPLPLPQPIFDPDDGQRLPATYANFLIMNKAVLLPTYAQSAFDNQALATLQSLFPDREIVPIDCRTLIRQHGSLHCCTMQFPEGVMGPII